MMLKKMIPGLLAAIIALGAVAFKKKDSPPFQATHTFYYQAPSGSYDEADVENKANWISNPSTAPSCGGSAKACQMEVNDTYTQNGAGGVRVFRTSGSVANIDAVVGSGTNYVPSTASPSVGITSKTDRPL